ncbi:hypothetical protein RJ641_019354 [Dillenia turbinata]|uniref:Uncharacterized protein n=1 Tax=Dillenia turbinata TaxID=194707 RepID=A0AAN8UGQ3_9MAGN
MSKISRLFSSEKLFGKIPMKPLPLISMTDTFPRNPSSGGKQPERSLFKNMTSCKSDILPMLLGMHPENLLLAKRMIDAVELPSVSGMDDEKRLLFKNKASSFLSNSSEGSSPSNSLNLMSRYLRSGIDRTDFGNGPTNLLLLISSSCIRLSLLKLLGTIPQNLLELMCKSAISDKSPSSRGRYPAMSPWLRSMPATTVMLGSSSAGVFNLNLVLKVLRQITILREALELASCDEGCLSIGEGKG